MQNNAKGAITETQKLIDRCCKPFSVEPNQLSMPSIKDGIPRVPCNMSKADFLSKYVQKRKAVILRGCQKSWRARKWTLEGILLFVDVYLTFQSSLYLYFVTAHIFT